MTSDILTSTHRIRVKPQGIQVLNSHKPEAPLSTLNASTPVQLYDINTVIPLRVLATARVRLEPLIPLDHLDGFLSLPKDSWDTLGDLGPYDRQSALREIEEVRLDPYRVLLAVIEKQVEDFDGDGFAGVYGITIHLDLMTASFTFINLHPRYHRTHVNTHAMHLILTFLFDELKLVRVQYDAAPFNETSKKAAIRLGFREEGICRNLAGLIPVAKRRKGEERRRSQDLWVCAMTDDDWEAGGRNRLARMCGVTGLDTKGN